MLILWGDLHFDNAVFSLVAFRLKIYIQRCSHPKLIAAESEEFGMKGSLILFLRWTIKCCSLDIVKSELEWRIFSINIIRSLCW
jgi:hypothetical protein